MDTERITEAIISTGAGPLALEEGAALAQSWIEEKLPSDAEDEIIAVECGFSVQVDERTWIIGVQDLIAADARGVYGFEFKTTKEPGRYWNEGKWLDSIKSGPQIAVYALALHRGVFYENGSPFVLSVPVPVRERVRAITKQVPPQYWPINDSDAWQVFDAPALDAVTNAFRSKAAQIRAARKLGVRPFQFPGRQCESFGKVCQYWDECTGWKAPEAVHGFDSDDPAAKLALPFLGVDAQHEDAVILSASSYQDYSRCMELGARNAVAGGKESNHALEVGTVLHAAVAEAYRQLREDQQSIDQLTGLKQK